MRGPISLATFMKQALVHPEHGYYCKQQALGAHGDFITSPEVSQVFGEVHCCLLRTHPPPLQLIAIWFITVWQQMGCPPKISLVELGPGKGTMCSDFLRVWLLLWCNSNAKQAAKQFTQFYSALEVHLVEVSPILRAKQASALGCVKMDDGESARIDETVRVQWHSSFEAIPPTGKYLKWLPWFFEQDVHNSS